MKKPSLLLLSIFCVLTAEYTQTAQPNKPLTKYQTFKKHLRDIIFFKKFGLSSINPETENYIRQIIKQMGMENYNIEIRTMSDTAKSKFGSMNAFVQPSLFARSELNILYISKDWFNTLDDQEKRALIGHELIHIKNVNSI